MIFSAAAAISGAVPHASHFSLHSFNFHKGSRIGITGSLQSRSFEDQSGNKRTVIEVLAEDVDFLDPKQKQEEKPEAEETLPIPPMPKNAEEEAAHMQFEADMADAGDAALPFDIMG